MSSRRQCVIIDGVRSNVAELSFGVPQGSSIGPVIFTQYASSLFDVVHQHLDDIHGYADDHQIYLAFSPNNVATQQSAILCMENCLAAVKSWMLSFKLKMNDGKTEFIIIGSRQQVDKMNCNSNKVGDAIVTAVDSVRDLGAYLDKNLSMETHIETKCRTAFKQLYNLRRIRLGKPQRPWFTHLFSVT